MLNTPEAGDQHNLSLKKSTPKDDEGLRAGLLAEVVFAALPLLLILLIFAHTRRLHELFASPEWSFGSAVLLGQTLAKFVSGLAKSGQTRPGAAALVTSLLLVFGLAPALIILALMLQAEHSSEAPSRWLQLLQVVYFFAAAVLYVIMGDVSERRQ